jgi:hypothetical protein
MGGGPLTLRCSSCKKHEDFRAYHRESADGLTATGRTKTGKYGHRHNVTRYELLHAKCGKLMWSNHWVAGMLYEKKMKADKAAEENR